MKIVLFLGAGASVPFGKPTTAMLKEKLLREYNQNTPHDELFRKILSVPTFTDIEYVVRAIEDVTNFSNTFGSEFLASFSDQTSTNTFRIHGRHFTYAELISTLKEIENSVKNEIFKNYWWNHGDDSDKKLIEIYDKVILFLKKNSSPIRIGTTNYDKVIEEYSKKKNIVLIDGFKPEEYTGRAFWAKGNFSYFDTLDKDRILLCKLHGSLAWKEHKTDGLERTNDESKSTYPNYVKDCIIYPTLDPKHPKDDEPYSSVRKQFDFIVRDSNVCIVIGYSFRDSHVNELFKDFINNKKTFIAIGPNVIKDFHENFEGKKYDVDENEHLTSEEISSDDERVFLLKEKLEVETIESILEDIEKYLHQPS